MLQQNVNTALPGHRWKVLGVGVAANASFSAVFQGIPTTAVLMRADYQLENGTLGLILGLLGLGIAISELPWGLLTDRWGDRKVLLSGLTGTTLALALMTLLAVPKPDQTPSAWTLGLGLVLVGLLGGSVNGSSGRAVMTWFKEGERGLAMSVRQTAVPLGGGLGALVLPTLASHHGFVAVYGLLALFCTVSLFFTWLWLHEPPKTVALGTPTAPGPTKVSTPAPPPLHDLNVWRFVAGIGLLCAPQFAVLTFATIFLHDFVKANIAAISVAMFIVQIGAMVSRVWSGRWTDKRGNRRAYLRVCALLSLGAFSLLALATVFFNDGSAMPLGGMVLLAILLVLAGICVSAWHGVAFTELATLVGTQQTGTALGMANTCVFIALFLTPIMVPVLLKVGTWSLVWLTAGGCCLLVLPLFPAPLVTALPTTSVKVLRDKSRGV